MDIAVSIAEATTAHYSVGEETRSLFSWLTREEELRGRVRLVEVQPPLPGTLGSLPTELLVMLGPGGAGAVLASAVIAWIRHRTAEVNCTLKRPDGTSVTLTGKRIRNADIAQLGELIGQATTALNAQSHSEEG